MEFLSRSPLGADVVESFVEKKSSAVFPRMSPAPSFVLSDEAGTKISESIFAVPHDRDAHIEDDRASIASSSGSPGSDHSETPSNSGLSDGSGISKDLESISMRGVRLSITAPGDCSWEEDSASNFSSSVFDSTRTCTTPTSECSEVSWKSTSGQNAEGLQKVGSAEYTSCGSISSDKERRIRKKGSVRRLESRMQTLELGTKTYLPLGCVKFAHKRNVIITAPTEILGANFSSPVGAGMDAIVTVDMAGVGRPHKILRVSTRDVSFNAETMVEPEDLYDQLWVALQFGDDVELIKTLLPKRVMTFSRSEPKDFGCWPDKYAILGEAASQGLVKTVRYLVEDLQCDPSAPYGKGLRSPLQIAAYNGHLEVSKLLLRFGVKVDHRDLNDETPLAAAIHAGHYHIARLIREQIDGKGGNSNSSSNSNSGAKAESSYGSRGCESPGSQNARPVPAWRSRIQAGDGDGAIGGSAPLWRSKSFNQTQTSAEHSRTAAPRESEMESSRNFGSANGLRSVSWKEAESRPKGSPASGSSSSSSFSAQRNVASSSTARADGRTGQCSAPASAMRSSRATETNTWRASDSREYRSLSGRQDDQTWRSERPTSGKMLAPTWSGNLSNNARRGGDESRARVSSYQSTGSSRASDAADWRK